MKPVEFSRRAIALGLMAGLVGCAVTPTLSPVKSPQAPGEKAQRQVLAVDDQPVQSLEDAKKLFAQLPQRLTPEQAKTMLVQIDPSKVEDVKDGKYQVQWRGGWGGWRGGYGGYGWRGLGWRGAYGYGLGYGLGYGAFSYYPYGGYLYPYSYYGGYYSPFSYGGYYPYLYGGYGGLYRPYSWYW